MTRTPTRRQYLTAGAVTGIAAFAGCIDNSGGADEPSENGTNDERVEDIDYSDPAGELAFVKPEDGAEVSNPVAIEMEVTNFELQPVGEDTSPERGAGHLHVLVDEGCVEPGYVIPQEEGYYHLSEGGREIEIELEPGQHDLCAQAGDAQHNAYAMTDEISITVTGGGTGNESESGNETGSESGNETESENESGAGNSSDD